MCMPEICNSYLRTVQREPSFGAHFYEVQTKSGVDQWLGIGYNGIALYEKKSKRHLIKVRLVYMIDDVLVSHSVFFCHRHSLGVI